METLTKRDATGRQVPTRGVLVVGCPFVTDEVLARAIPAAPEVTPVLQEVISDLPETTPATPEATPVLPDWEGPCLHHVVPTLAAQVREPGRAPLPSWFPDEVAGAGQIVLLVLDGLGAEQLRERSGLAPVLSGGSACTLTTVVPSTTACALTSLATGRAPAEHGVVGYRVAQGGEVMNVLQWSRRGVDAPHGRPSF